MNLPLSFTLTLDLGLLPTWGACDAATTELNYKLQTYTTHDANLDLADVRSARTASSATSSLADKDGEIARVQSQLTATGLTAEEEQDLRDVLELLLAQRKQLVKHNRQAVGSDRFLKVVDAGQTESQVQMLRAVLAAIATHRATLSA